MVARRYLIIATSGTLAAAGGVDEISHLPNLTKIYSEESNRDSGESNRDSEESNSYSGESNRDSEESNRDSGESNSYSEESNCDSGEFTFSC